MILTILLSLYYPLDDNILPLIFVIPLVVGNVLACWIGNSTYKQSALNGGIIGILPIWILLIFGYGNPAVLILFLVMGSLGGILGKFITTKIVKNPLTEPIKKIKLILLFIFVIMGGIFGTSMIFAASNNMTYDNHGISFSYLGGLVASDNPGNTHPFGTGNNLTVTTAFNGANKTGAESDYLIISQGAATMPLQDQVNVEKESIQKSNGTIGLETNLTVDGAPATEIDYNASGVAGVDLLFIKNNTLYDLNFNYGINNELQRYTVFLTIENSLHIK